MAYTDDIRESDPEWQARQRLRDRERYRAEILAPVLLTTGSSVDTQMTDRQREAAVDLVVDAVEANFDGRTPNYEKTLRYLLDNGFTFIGDKVRFRGGPDTGAAARTSDTADGPKYGRFRKDDVPDLLQMIQQGRESALAEGVPWDDRQVAYDVLWALSDLGYDVIKRTESEGTDR